MKEKLLDQYDEWKKRQTSWPPLDIKNRFIEGISIRTFAMTDMQIKIDPAISEHLAALQSSINKSLIKAAESARQIKVKIAADLAKLTDSVRRRKASLPGKFKTLAMNGWFIYGYRVQSTAIYPIASLFEADRIDEGNQAMCWQFNNILSNIEADLIECFPKRALILKKAFAAHKVGDYELSIPVLLAQADGIARDTIGKSIPKFSIYSEHKSKPAIEAFIDEFANVALLGSDILEVASIKMPLNVSEGDAMLIGEVLNRHQILHGANTDYATLTNSCRAISWLDYVSYFHKLRSKRRNELLQNCEGGCGQ